MLFPVYMLCVEPLPLHPEFHCTQDLPAGWCDEASVLGDFFGIIQALTSCDPIV